jgi:hypothetical protein
MCGLSFENPIDAGVVSTTARLLGIVEHPTAAMGNIAAGRKRSAAKADQPDDGHRDLLATRPPRS